MIFNGINKLLLITCRIVLLFLIPFPGLQSVTGQTGKWGLLTHTDNDFKYKYFAKKVQETIMKERKK
jgi:hypothetical protein